MLNWIAHTNIYEVNLRQYTEEGTLSAFARHLPRLRDMGVETLWFMPLTPISQKNRKGSMGSYYACSDYTAVAEEFGTVADFRQLVLEAHAMGFKVILDWVANHTGWDHRWTVEHPDWYEKDEQTGDFKKASGMDDIIELDFRNAAMRRAMTEAMQWWVRETDIDGFRCDLAFWVELDFWREARPQLDALKPLFWLGEMDALEHVAYLDVFDAAYTWQWMHQTEKFYRGHAGFGDLLRLLDAYQSAPGVNAWFTSNHDENSWNGTEYEKYGRLAPVLAVFSCTWPGIPLLYSGQELPNHKRLQFFEKDVIEWDEQVALHPFYQTLLTLKKTHPALATPASLQVTQVDEHQQVLVFKREAEGSEVWVALNFGAEQRAVLVPGDAGLVPVLCSEGLVPDLLEGLELPPYGFSVWKTVPPLSLAP